MNYLNIPGLSNSGAGHWQTIWENLYPSRFKRVKQKNWLMPEKNEWVDGLTDSISRIVTPTILVAHSLGCIALVHWAKKHVSEWVKGALLVAPADVDVSDREDFKTFSPVPLDKLPFPTIVVASMNDPYISMERAAKWAAYWGSKFIGVGNRGHINASSGLQEWEEGQNFLKLLPVAAQAPAYRHAI